MRFNLTPDIMIETEEELELALDSLTASGVDAEWLGILRERATPHVTQRRALVEGLQRLE